MKLFKSPRTTRPDDGQESSTATPEQSSASINTSYAQTKPIRLLQTKTYAFTLNKVTDGTADEAVNRFCASHHVLSVSFDRVQATLLYRLLYTLH